MNYSIYNLDNGKIVRVVSTNNIDLQLLDNEQYIDGSYDDSMYYVANGTAVAMPVKPNYYDVFDYSTKQWVVDENIAINNIKNQRNQLLVYSDWTQIPNNPLTTEQQTAWATYRQELRDIPLQSGYPFNVVWPVAPI
jgi:hypothetical protein